MEQLYDENHIALGRYHRYQNPNSELLRHFQHSPQLRLQQIVILTQHTHATVAEKPEEKKGMHPAAQGMGGGMGEMMHIDIA
jgi:hypothetical protein